MMAATISDACDRLRPGINIHIQAAKSRAWLLG